MLSLLLAFILGCGGDAPPAAPAPATPPAPAAAPAPATAPAAAQVHVADAWVRAMPPGSPNTGAFLTLHNGGAETAVVSASSDVAEKVELHTHVMENGVANMRQVPSFPLPAGAMHALAPGGDHVMLIGLKRDLAVGEDVVFTLRFADGSEQAVTAKVQEMPMPADAAKGHEGH